jgi:hypothetical protein
MREKAVGSNRRIDLRLCVAGVAAAGLMALATAAPAGAVVTIGSNLGRAPDTSAVDNGSLFQSTLPTASQAANGLTSPVNGTVTQWRIRSGAGGTTSLQIFRPFGATQFTGVGTSSAVTIPAGSISTFPVSLPISIGDRIGNRHDGSDGGLQWFVSGPAANGTILFFVPHLNDGDTRTVQGPQSFEQLVNADINPTNTFTLGETTRNKKKGTATITANLPNPGELTASGKGVKAAGVAIVSKTVTAPGATKLVIRAKGKKKQKLNDVGKVKLNAKLTFTPTGGTPATASRKVKLKKNL